MRVAVLVLEGVFDSGLSVVLDTLTTANDLAAESRRTLRFEVTVGGVARSVETAQGLRVTLAPLRADRPPDVVIVPALGCKTRETILAALERRDVRDACALLRAWSASGAKVAGACTATFVLACAGLLDGGRATTTWWLSPTFREQFPRVELDESRMIVQAGSVVTAGAALAHVDLALWLVRRKSPALAHAVARYLVFDTRPSQAAFALPDHCEHDDPLVARFEHWARSHLCDFDLAAAARHVGASERTLERRIRAVLGRTPLSYVQDLRVEAAVHRLRTTKDSIDAIAATVGYADGVTLRTLLRKKTGRGVRELRAPPS
ncbi:MAG TPA: helix-turn-helix domain-containing protein [Labilithrix sp.]